MERGATEEEILATAEHGERYPVKFGRTGFRRNFVIDGEQQGRLYATKQLKVIAVPEDDWLVLTVIVRFF